MNALIPALAGLLSVATPSLPEASGLMKCAPLEPMPAAMPGVVMLLDNAVWEIPEGLQLREAMEAAGVGQVLLQCWDPETGRFLGSGEGIPIARMFSGTPTEALECGIPETVMPAETPAWQKCDRADELASAAVREIWDTAVEAERMGKWARSPV